jgi:hypothetical protein
MTLQRMDNVLIVVDDLEAAKAFFAELGRRAQRRPCRHHHDADPGPGLCYLRGPEGIIIGLAEQLS